MTFLRWLLVAGCAFVFLLLAVSNWTPVPFIMPAGDPVTVPLPMLLLLAFSAGWLPTWLLHIGARAGWRRRLAKVESNGMGAIPKAPNPPAAAPPAPSLAQPIIVPPAGA